MSQTQTLGKYHFKKAGKSQLDGADTNQLNSQPNHKAAPQRLQWKSDRKMYVCLKHDFPWRQFRRFSLFFRPINLMDNPYKWAGIDRKLQTETNEQRFPYSSSYKPITAAWRSDKTAPLLDVFHLLPPQCLPQMEHAVFSFLNNGFPQTPHASLYTSHCVCPHFLLPVLSCPLRWGSPLDLQTACAIYSKKTELHFCEITPTEPLKLSNELNKIPEVGYLTCYVADDIGIV